VLLLEHEGKKVLEKYGIPIPRGRLVTNADQVSAAVGGLAAPFMVKAQALTGGRGKAGGIRPASDAASAKTEVERLLGAKLKDQDVSGILIEEKASFLRERYMSIMLDGEAINLLFGKQGGVEVESYFSDAKDNFQVVRIDPAYGLGAYQIRKAAEALKIDVKYWPAYVRIAESLYSLFKGCDATLAEINPIVELEGGDLIALDSRIVVDDGAFFRQPEFAAIDRVRTKGDGLLKKMRDLEIQYVPVGGNIGLVSSGAGVGVTIMDWLDKEGAKLSAFVDLDYAIMGGHAEAGIKLMFDTFYDDPSIKAIIVNFTTCGLRLDLIVGSLLAALEGRSADTKPIFFHLQGNRAPIAHEMLAKAGWKVSENLGDAVRVAAKTVRSA
jgi:succinyl-CoA synthetase beta subunit